MVDYGSSPSMTYSDMNGFGPNVKSAFWFTTYWILVASLLTGISALLYVRGIRSRVKERWSMAKVNFNSQFKKVTIEYEIGRTIKNVFLKQKKNQLFTNLE